MSTIPLKRALAILKTIAGPGDWPVTASTHPDGLCLTADDDRQHRLSVVVPGTTTATIGLPYSGIAVLATGARLDLTVDDVRVSCGGSVALGFLAPAPTPRFGDGADTPRRTVTGVDAAAVHAALTGVLPFVSDDSTRTGLNGAHWGRMAMVATDGHRLGAAAVPVTSGPPGAYVIARDTIRLLDRLPVPTSIAEGDIRIDIVGPGFELRSMLLDGEFPDWTQIIPKTWIHRARVAGLDRHAAEAARAAKTMGMTKTHPMRATVNGSWETAVKGFEGGSWSGSVPCEHEGPLDDDGATMPITLGFNARYLADAAEFVGSDDVDVQIGDTLSPVLLAGTIPGRLAIVMPMRLE